MKARLAILQQHVATLGRLLKNFPALEDLNVHVSPLWADKLSAPSIFIDARHRARVAELFGADGWKRRAVEGAKSVQARKLCDGIEIVMDQFEPCATNAMPVEIAPELLRSPWFALAASLVTPEAEGGAR